MNAKTRSDARSPEPHDVITLGDVAEIVRGIAFPKTARSDTPEPGRIACLRTANVQAAVEWDDLWYVPTSFVKKERQQLRVGDILISIANSYNLVGKVALVRDLPGEATLGAFIAAIRPSPDLDARFLYHQLNSPHAQAAIREMASTTTNISNVSTTKLGRLPVMMPSHNEQVRIVEEIEKQLTRLEAGVAALERVRTNLKRYRAAVLKAACEGRLVPTEAALARQEGRPYEHASVLLERIRAQRTTSTGAFRRGEVGRRLPAGLPKDLPTLPEGWVWATVDTVGELLLGRQRAPQFLTGKHPRPYLRVANVKDDRIDFSDVQTMDFDQRHFNKYQLAPGDILLSEGQSPELVGQSAIYHGQIDGLCFQKTLHRFRPVPEGPAPGFAQLVFRSHVRTGVFRRFASITTNIAHLTLEKLRVAPFPLPPAREQDRIVAEAERRLSLAEDLERTVAANLGRATRLRQSVLAAAFGEVH